jgi:TonB-linked SusC/RagA family outer membrane protein
MKKVLLLFACLSFLSMQVFAQRTVTGTVTSADDGMGLPGVSVIVKGTSNGTITDVDGKYSLEVPADANTLVFQFMGMETQEIEVTGDVVNAAMESSDIAIDDVVVTALGVTREKKSLGYSVQEVDGSAVNDVRQNNFVGSLSGKVAGVEIKQPGTMGGSVNVLIRGTTSIMGNNQALFVVDGVPIDNSVRGTDNVGENWGGYDMGNTAADINPDDIESISVLRGAAATVLYGSRASNGVILITTKKGSKKKGIGVTVNSGLMISKIDKATMPKYQKKYGGGYGPFYEDASGYFFEADVDGDGTLDLIMPTSEDASWGAKFDPNLMVVHWDALHPELPNYGEKRPWVAAENGLDYFFRTGYQWINNIAFDGGTENGTFRLSYTNLSETGNLPNSEQKRNTINFSGSYKFSDKMNVETNVTYVNNDFTGRYGTGYDGANPMQALSQWFQTNVDFKRLEENYMLPDGSQMTWNKTYWDDPFPIYADNPYWTRYKNYTNDERNRVYGYAKFNYELTDWLEFVGRFANDFYSETWEERTAIGSNATSDYTNTQRNFNESNTDLMLKFNKNINDFSLSGIVGSNFRQTKLSTVRSSTVGGLIIPDFYSVANSVSPKDVAESDIRKGVNSVYGQFSFGYGNFVYIDLAGRNDWSSSLPKDSRSFFYPSVSGSLILSELGPLKDITALSYAKLRANYAEVGSDAPAYSVYNSYAQGTNWGNDALFTMPSTLNNANLKPERTKSLEFGLEANFLNNRVGFDVSYYKTKTFDQIIPIDISAGSGYTGLWYNAGQLDNWGIELALRGTPIKAGDFTWDVNVNWFMNRNKVINYNDADGNALIDNVLLYTNWDVSINAKVGEPYGTIRGTDFVYANQMVNGVYDPDIAADRSSGKVVNDNGYYMISDDSEAVIGDINPDWMMGISNTFSYKGITLSFLIDWKHGGDVYSINTKYGQATGLYEETAGTNVLGNEMRANVVSTVDGDLGPNFGGGIPLSEAASNSGGYILPGVKADGSANDILVNSGRWGRAFYYNNSPTARYVFDASYVKLRELSLGYTLPQSFISKTPFTNIAVSVVGRNLLILSKNVDHFDPEAQSSAGNLQGIESGSYPTTRTIGFNIKLGF